MAIFRFFELVVFIASKGVFSFLNIVNDLFFAYSAKKKKLEKWPFVDQNHGFGLRPWINPFGKMSIFRFFELLVLIP